MSDPNNVATLWQESKSRLIPAAMVGSFLEWYDVAIYAQASALVLAPLFFPRLNPTAGELASIATFTAGFAARPLGALILGQLGDRYGRRFGLIAALVLMGVATTTIGALPTYKSIGIWAPVLLVSLRFVQGLGAGTEYAGAVTLLGEYAPSRWRGFVSSLPAVSVLGGISVAAGITALMATLPKQQLLAWGWRIPFLVSIVLLAIGLFLRLKVLESPIFEAARERVRTRVPVATVIKEAPRRFTLATIANIGTNSFAQILQVFILAYLAKRGVRSSVSLLGLLIGVLIGALSILPLTLISDRIGRRPVYLATQAFLVATPFPLFLLIDTKKPALIWLGMIVGWLGTSTVYGIQSGYYVELFKTPYRITGVALSRELAAGLFGAPAPLLAALIVTRTGGNPWPLAAVMVIAALGSLAAALALPETRGIPLARGAETRPFPT